MNILERTLYKTRKSVFEACTENDIQYPSEIEIGLTSCSSCGIWLVEMKKDQDGLDTCDLCQETYGH